MGEQGSDAIIGTILEKQNARLTVTVPNAKTKISATHRVPSLSKFKLPQTGAIADGVEAFFSGFGAVFGEHKEFAYIFSQYFTLGLSDGWLKPHPHELVPGGLNGLVVGLTKLQHGEAHAVKYVCRISGTEGVGRGPN